MRLPQIINEAMAIPKSQAIVDGGTMISGMILNLLSDAKIRLYRMSQFFLKINDAFDISPGNQTLIRPISPKSVQAMFSTILSIQSTKSIFNVNPQQH